MINLWLSHVNRFKSLPGSRSYITTSPRNALMWNIKDSGWVFHSIAASESKHSVHTLETLFSCSGYSCIPCSELNQDYYNINVSFVQNDRTLGVHGRWRADGGKRLKLYITYRNNLRWQRCFMFRVSAWGRQSNSPRSRIVAWHLSLHSQHKPWVCGMGPSIRVFWYIYIHGTYSTMDQGNVWGAACRETPENNHL